jgi:DNA helicase IV
MSQPTKAASSQHPDVAAEQVFLNHAYACLDFMHGRAVRLKALGYQGGNVHAESGLTPEMAAKWDLDKKRRVDSLADASSALCFGRIDRRDGERFHIGRRHVEDRTGEPVVTDWRAPTAVPFYRATVVDPMKLRLRRRFLVEGRHLVDLLDEDLEHPDTDVGAYVPDPLLAEIERDRTAEMRDIVATIQAEQDVIIRAPFEECIVVQGGPGTGKTAVGLHRAAFLLYTHRELFQRERLLIVGPNKIFLRYIAQVLPSLGETTAVQLTIEGLAGARFVLRGEDEPATVRVKGDKRMAEVVRRATFARVKSPTKDITLSTPFGDVTLAAEDVTAIVEAARSSLRPANHTRAVVRDRLVSLAWNTYLGVHPDDFPRRGVFADAVRSGQPLKGVLDKLWPARSAPDVVRQLYGNRRILREATDGLVALEARDRLARRPTARLADERWTFADLALLHEAEAIINGVPSAYGHIVVDEAQDLSAMELRMLGRRSRRGSMTVLGDLAQSTAPAGQSSWDHVLEHLGTARGRREELTVGYRVPAPILDFANQLLGEAAPGVRPATSARLHGASPKVVNVSSADRPATLAAESARLAEQWTSLGIVTPASLYAEVMTALRAAQIDFVDGRAASALGEHVTVLLPTSTKGLEFDAVIVVEPARIVAEDDNGMRLLYVVLTRAVQHLSLVHSEPLPDPLTQATVS